PLSFFLLSPAPRSTLLPYTTLFRSGPDTSTETVATAPVADEQFIPMGATGQVIPGPPWTMTLNEQVAVHRLGSLTVTVTTFVPIEQEPVKSTRVHGPPSTAFVCTAT